MEKSPRADHGLPDKVPVGNTEGVPVVSNSWETSLVSAGRLKVHHTTIRHIANKYRDDHPEWFRTAVVRTRNTKAEHYSPELLKVIEQEISKRVEAPKGWRTPRSMALQTDKSPLTIVRMANKYRADHPDWFKNYIGTNRHDLEHYSPELVDLIESLSKVEYAPQGWTTIGQLATKLGVDFGTIRKASEVFMTEQPESFKTYLDRAGTSRTHFSPLITKKIEMTTTNLSKTHGWETPSFLAKKLGKDPETIVGKASEYLIENPELEKIFRTSGGVVKHYSPELLAKLTEYFSELKKAPDGWLTNREIVKMLGITKPTVSTAAKKYEKEHPQSMHKYLNQGKLVVYHSPELVQKLKSDFGEIEWAPEGWLTIGGAIGTFGSSTTAHKIVDKYRLSHPEWYRNFRTNQGVFEHFSPELAKIIADEISTRENSLKESRGNTERKEKLERDCENFFRDVSEDKTIEAQEFKKLLSIFGSNHLFDILYKYRPEFSGIPTDYVKGTLAKYLGDFLIIRTNFRIEDLDIALPHLSNNSLQDSLFEVIKEDCLKQYHGKKIEDKTANDREIIAGYIQSIKERSSQLNSSELTDVIDRVERYFQSILEDFKKPDNIIDVLREGRTFPDLNQTLNIKEISEKKKMLIGDEMGMGKSASAILSKEYLGSKLALVVVPSNVTKTWENYLSDKVAENGKQVGYFKQGMAPRVLVVENQESLSEIEGSQFDYIVISQEKMNARYAELLKAVNYDMLILDEAHKFKNLDGGERPQHILELAEAISGENEHLILLSGTPIPNKIKDVATILRLLYPEQFKDIKDAELVESVIQGDIIDIRNLLVPRMQMKGLRESIKMPELLEETDITNLSSDEQDIYEILLEDDELTADQKIRAFRKFVMNPSSLEVTPNIEGSKIHDVSTKLNKVFAEKNKVVLFVNGYVEGMIRGENTILEKLNLQPEITVRVIEGNVSKEERDAIQTEFHDSQGKILLAVSGQTADVGVDFSAAEYIQFYNDPWTLYDKKQQTARGYRPGLENDLTVGTSVVAGTIEEGIEEYIQLKYDAIQKVLKGIPVTDIEKKILRTAEKQKTPDIEGSLEIAKEWLNSPQNRLHRFFGMTKEIGEKNFNKFLLEHGEEYAESYADMGSLGFQANTARIVGTFISRFAEEQNQSPEELRVLDIASGPEMLKKHIHDAYKDSVYSMDINQAHFQNEGSNRIVGSFGKLPIAGKSVDYVNLSLALHYSRLTPRRGDYERIAVLTEMNRVLKNKGRAVINLLYSLRFKDENQFKELATSLGFKTVEEYTGDISSGPYYRSHAVVLEKEADIDANFEELIKTIPKQQIEGAKFRDTEVSSLKNSRRCVRDFSVNDQGININFNSEDQKVLNEQESIIEEGEMLKGTYGSIKSIPAEEIIGRNFLRINNGKSYRLLKKSELLNSFVDVR